MFIKHEKRRPKLLAEKQNLPIMTILKSGVCSFNPALIEKHNLRNYKCADIFYNVTTDQIGFKFHLSEEEGAMKLTPYENHIKVNTASMFSSNGINPVDIAGRYYGMTICQSTTNGRLHIVDLGNKIQPAVKESSKNTNNSYDAGFAAGQESVLKDLHKFLQNSGR
jgi:hypothetical protein